MARTIRHFMWGYQEHFRVHQEFCAKTLFASLDERFRPEVFLVGIRIEDLQDRFPACVEPEEDFWIRSEAFNDVLMRVSTIVRTYPERQILQSHPLAQKWHDEGLMKRAVQEAIMEVIGECPDKPDGMRYSPSWPVPVQGYLVTLLLGLQESVRRSHASLKTDCVKIHEYRSFKVPTSLIEAVTGEYLDDAAGELFMPDPGADLVSGKSRDEILRAAGKRMMAGVAQRADTWKNQEGHEENLLDECNKLSARNYEGAASVGCAVLARRDHPAVRTEVAFVRSIPVRDRTALRKFLELAKQDLALHMNAKDLFGLARVIHYDPEQEDLYEIRILDRNLWELSHDGKPLMRVKDGLPCLPAPAVDATRVRTDLHRMFSDLTNVQGDLLTRLVSEAAAEKHGTMLVISGDAASEAKRLANQATLLEPCRLTPALLKQLTSIDGAVLLDPNGTCHAVGVILDGIATQKGNPARGARFNSAIRYVETKKTACMAFVVSEDGGVDLVPDLRPMVRRSEIEEAIAEMERLLVLHPVNLRRFRQLTDWLDDKRFYLLPGDCTRVNKAIAAIDARIAQEDPEAPHWVRREFAPDPGFDPGLYYEKE